MPKVTVITPNYNHAKYLPERIDSILAQTFQDFELLILDNASTDNSREVIGSYTRHQKVRAIFKRKTMAAPSNSGNSDWAKQKVNISGSPNRTITRTPRCWRLSSTDWIGTPTWDSPCVSRGWSTKTVNCWETLEICWNIKITVHTGAKTTSTRATMSARNTCSGTAQSVTRVRCSGDVKSSNVRVGCRPICG